MVASDYRQYLFQMAILRPAQSGFVRELWGGIFYIHGRVLPIVYRNTIAFLEP